MSQSSSTARGSGPQLWTLLGAVILLLGIYFVPSPAPLERAGTTIPLTPQGQACLAIMAFAVLLWVTETVPFAVTSLLVVLLIPLFKLADFRAVVRAGFGDPIVAFFIGVLMLSAAVDSGTRWVSLTSYATFASWFVLANSRVWRRCTGFPNTG